MFPMERGPLGAFSTQKPKTLTIRAPRGYGPFPYDACSVIPVLLNLEHVEVYPGQQCPAVGQLRAQRGPREHTSVKIPSLEVACRPLTPS